MVQFALRAPWSVSRNKSITPLILNFVHWMDVNNHLEASKRLDFQPFRYEELSRRQNWWSGHMNNLILKTENWYNKIQWFIRVTCSAQCGWEPYLWLLTRDSYCVTDDDLSEGVWSGVLHFLGFRHVAGACPHVSLRNNRALSTLLRHEDNLKDSLIVNELQHKKKETWRFVFFVLITDFYRAFMNVELVMKSQVDNVEEDVLL